MKPEDDLWDTIANSKCTYRLQEIGVSFENAKLGYVVRVARKLAEAKEYPLTVEAFYEGQWFQMDIAYPSSYSK